MKKILLAIIISSILGTNAFAENAYKDANTPERLVIIQYDGKYLVGGESSGAAYAEAQKVHVNKFADERLSELTGSAEDIEQKKLIINGERDAALKLLDVKGEYADLAISNMKGGMAPGKAKEAAAAATFGAIQSEAGSQTGYNEGSATSTLSSGGGSTVPNSDFKQFNELDCSYSDVSNYIDKSLDPKTKAFSTSPGFSSSFKKTASKAAVSLKGEEEAACQTIFDDAVKFSDSEEFSFSKISSGMPTWDEFGSKLDDLGNKAGEQLGDLTTQLYGVLREGICSRMSSDYVGELAGDLVEDQYSEETKGTALDGTRIDNLDKESGQNSFTYKIIKNQSELSDSDLIKAIDVTREDQQKYQDRFLDGELDDVLDDLEDSIFGK